MYTTEYSQLTLGVSTRPSGARHDPRQNSSNHRLKAGWKPKSSMSCWRLSLYLPFAKSKETLTSAWAVKRSEIGGLGGRSAHAREAVGCAPGVWALTLGVPTPTRRALRRREGPS